jgi:enoyl-CoA hydratase/carnithine racemase
MPSRKRSKQPHTNATTGVAIAREGDVLTFTLQNIEEDNQVTCAMFDAMLLELRTQSRRPSTRVLRIQAEGKIFCTGRERAGRNRQQVRHESARLIDFKRAVRTSPLISIAEVQGDALGFGFGLAIVSDFVLVAENAALGFPEMRSGLAPSAIMAYLGEYTLPRWAFPLVLFGEPFTPQRALEIGLISQVCSAERLTAEADSLVRRILQLDPAATRRCKEFFLTAQQNSFARNCRLATDALTAGSLAALARQK